MSFLKRISSIGRNETKRVFPGSLERVTRVVTRLLLGDHAHHLLRGETRD